MDDQKKKAIAAAAKEISKRPYSEITSGENPSLESLVSWTPHERIYAAAESFIAGAAVSFWVWIWDGAPRQIGDTWPSFWWVIGATVLLTVIGFINPGGSVSLHELIRSTTTERKKE